MAISAFKILTVLHPLASILFVSHVAKHQVISVMDILVHMMLIVLRVLVLIISVFNAQRIKAIIVMEELAHTILIVHPKHA